MTFPDVSHLASRVPGDNGDALFNLWLLRWLAHAAPGGFGHLWNTDIFRPATNTLAYSDPLLALAPVYWALERLTGSTALSYNLIYLLAWTLSLWFTYRLALYFTGRHGPSAVAALAFTFPAVRLAHVGHWQLCATGWALPLVLLLASRYCRERRLRDALLLGLAVAALTVTSSYYGVMTAVTVALVALGYALVGRPRPLGRYLAGLAAGGLLAAVVVAPVAWHYVKLQQDPHFDRPPDANLAAHPADFLAPVEFGYVLPHVPPFSAFAHSHRSVERRLFPGVVALALGAVGALEVLRRSRRRAVGAGLGPDSERARLAAVMAGAALVFLVLAFGRSRSVMGHALPLPLSLVDKVVPGFSGIRATSRFALVFQCVLALLAAMGLSRLLERARPRPAALVSLLLGLAVLAETASPVDSIRLPTAARFSAVNRALSDRPAGLTVELPVGSPGDGLTWGFIEAPRMFLATIDWHDRVNGYSGFAPAGFDTLAGDLESFPGPAALARIDALKIRYVVIRTITAGVYVQTFRHTMESEGVASYQPATVEAMLSAAPPGRVARVDRYPGAYLVELRG